MSDSLEEMKLRVQYKQLHYPYLYDGATQSVARAYGPQATPHVFIFDRERHLRYEGRMDNSYRTELVKTQDARNAIDALLANQDVAGETHRRVRLLHQMERKGSVATGSASQDRIATRAPGDGFRRGTEKAAHQSHRQNPARKLLGHLVRLLHSRISRRGRYLSHVRRA